jgi:hypothetical protein
VDYEGQSEATHEAEADLSAQDLVDFSPVYKCLHIYTVLGEREEFEKYYRKQRRQQASLTLQPPANMHEAIDGYRVYFHGIVGFFVCEDHVLNTGNGLISRYLFQKLQKLYCKSCSVRTWCYFGLGTIFTILLLEDTWMRSGATRLCAFFPHYRLIRHIALRPVLCSRSRT